jgi:signal transduction histidine kinase
LWPLESLVYPNDKTGLRNKWAEAVRSGCPFEIELRLQRMPDRTWRWHLMRTAPIRTNDGTPVRWFGTFTDIEDQKRAEEALRQREKLESVGLLAGGIAHDFNNLLVGIMGGASFVRDALDHDHSAYPMLEIVLRSSERAAHLTQQLLAYAGKVQISLQPGDISRIARDACEPVRTSIPGNISLTVETADDIPIVDTHEGHLREVIVSLVMNAAEAIGEKDGVVKVRTAIEPVGDSSASGSSENQANVLGYQLPPGRYVLVEVSDSGPGMDDRTQTQIFDPFFTTKFMGRGLGLAAVQGIVRSLGGGIRVNSAAGSGSAFQVLLPIRDVAARNGSG